MSESSEILVPGKSKKSMKKNGRSGTESRKVWILISFFIGKRVWYLLFINPKTSQTFLNVKLGGIHCANCFIRRSER